MVVENGKMLKNEATKAMAKNLARNLVYYAQLLKKYSLVPKIVRKFKKNND